tara:strand:- start:104 stop:2482 length:2379 start_codon:yes stop_codon:yes gene_type:complete
MKNKFIIFFFVYFILSKISLAEQFIFQTSEIEIADEGNIIYAKNGKAISPNKDLEIEAKSFEYQKKENLLKAFDGIAYIKSDNLKIEFKSIELDQEKNLIVAKEEIKIIELENKFTIETQEILYDRNLNLIKSDTNSKIKDNFRNEFISGKFQYEVKKNIFKVQNAKFKDFNNNIFNIEIAFINTLSNRLIGKDISIDLNNKSFDPMNEPRLKGKSIDLNKEKIEITKGVFTTCKRNDNCPPWQLSAEKIIHDRQKKIINYKNAWLKIYDVPVVYFPKFFHPDPTVNRKSGFLIPTVKSSSKSNFLNIPYYHVISDNKDITFTPRLYTEDKILLQSEYRQVNSNSNFITDLSFFKEKNNDSKNHFFYELEKNFDYLDFDDNNLNLTIQKTNNDTYLRANKLKSSLITDVETLRSSFNLNLYSEETTIDAELTVFEDLNKISTDRYEFILPRVNLSKKIKNKTNLNGDFTFNSNNLIRNYDTNIFEKTNINELVFNSIPNISKNGFYNNFDFIFKNINSDSQNSSKLKENTNTYLSGLFQFNSSLPLKKENDDYRNILKPKFSLKLSPNNTANIRDEDIRLDVNNVYDFNRISAKDTVEGGASIIYGTDFTIFNKNKSREILGFKIANNFRFDENDDLPVNNQIGQKTSNFFSEISYNPNEIFSTKYNTSYKNNLSDVSYENLTAEISLNNLVTTFDYLNENNISDKNSYLVNSVKYKFDESNNLIFSTRENKETNLTEYYNLMYQYKNDCLVASIEYNKDYYDDRDIKPEENIFLKLTIIPFGQTSSPNLKD